jgi:hypothetical protein
MHFSNGGSLVQRTRFSLSLGTPQQIESLVDEVIRTNAFLADQVCGWPYDHCDAYNQRWNDLTLCLELDGYRVEDNRLIPIDPAIHGVAADVEDDLSRELSNAQIAEGQLIMQTISDAIEAFRRVPADHNGCLTNARVALQTLAKAIALKRRTTHPGTFNENSWGQVIMYLRTSGFITPKEEEGLTGTYSFISPGAHHPVAQDEQEMARLGLSFALSMCYFLVKLHNRP